MNFEDEFINFDKTIEELNQLAKEIDSDCAALDEAFLEYDKIKKLESQLKATTDTAEAAKIKTSIKEGAERIDVLMNSIKSVSES